MTLKHSPLQIGLRVGAFVAFIIAITFNALSSLAGRGVTDLFLLSTGVISDLNYLEITPAGWTFSIWGIIYTWQGIWLVFSLVNIFRTTPQGPVYLNPLLLPHAFFIIYIFNLALNVSWLFLWDRQIMEAAYPVLVLIVLTLYACLWLSHRSLYHNKDALAKENRKSHDIMVRVFVHNGLGIYAGWTSIASFINMGVTIAYSSNPSISTSIAASVALGGLTALLLAYVVLDLTVFDKYTRYTIAPYGVVIWALSGSVSGNFNPSLYNTIWAVVLLALGVILLVTKIVFIIIRSKSKPVISSSTGVTKTEKDNEMQMQTAS